MNQPPSSLRSRRWMVSALGLTSAGAVLTACGGTGQQTASNTEATNSPATPTGFAARFAEFEPADEPNGDLAQVTWPEFVTAAGPEIQRLYAFQVENGPIMRYMPCFCGCHLQDGHRNNRDCYVEAVYPDGFVTFDPMAPT